jgi:hypothetical protein
VSIFVNFQTRKKPMLTTQKSDQTTLPSVPLDRHAGGREVKHGLELQNTTGNNWPASPPEMPPMQPDTTPVQAPSPETPEQPPEIKDPPLPSPGSAVTDPRPSEQRNS